MLLYIVSLIFKKCSKKADIMKNYWFVPRPKRKLISVPETFSVFMAGSLNKEWAGQVGKQISFEDTLEEQG